MRVCSVTDTERGMLGNFLLWMLLCEYLINIEMKIFIDEISVFA
jgi:hypothetical protein